MKNLGMNVAVCNIEQFEDQKVLVVERFDRKIEEDAIIRLPQEDICQALGKVSGSKYEEKGWVELSASYGFAIRFKQRGMKIGSNFCGCKSYFGCLPRLMGMARTSVLHSIRMGYRLTPFYDVLSAYPYFGQGNIPAKENKDGNESS